MNDVPRFAPWHVIGRRIRAHRECAGLSLRDVERLTAALVVNYHAEPVRTMILPISNSYLSQIENGGKADPSLAKVLAVMDALELDVDSVRAYMRPGDAVRAVENLWDDTEDVPPGDVAKAGDLLYVRELYLPVSPTRTFPVIVSHENVKVNAFACSFDEIEHFPPGVDVKYLIPPPPTGDGTRRDWSTSAF